jgi:serine/threonine protein kinase
MDRRTIERLGRYRVEALLRRASTARVYRAYDPIFERTVAIKVLNSALTGDPQFVARFLREGRALARQQHPHNLPV